MPQTISELMTPDPRWVGRDATLQEAARVMRDADIGDVVVLNGDGRVCGIVTDRDLVVRAVAEGMEPTVAQVEAICNHEVVSIAPGDAVARAVSLMRQHSVRRLPVVDGDRLVGIVTLGDLAVERDPDSALAEISKAPPNN